MYSSLISIEELSRVLSVTERTVKALVKSNQIPFRKEKNKICFDFNEVMEHFLELERGAA